MNRRYRYHIDRKTYYWTTLHLMLFAVLGMGLFQLYENGYLYAWFISFIGATVLLMGLSIPRNVVVDDERLTIKCLLDMTQIDLEHIISVRKVSPWNIRWVVPIFAGCGFFGYYGHFFDFRHFRRIVIYASEWNNMVEIVDEYEDYYYISCRDWEGLITELSIKMAIAEEIKKRG